MNPAPSSKDIRQIFGDRVRIDNAIREAFMQAIEDHRRSGVSMVFWKDGKVIHLNAEEVLALQVESGPR